MKAEILAQRIKMLVFDVDGVLTGGQIFVGQDGEIMKAFHVQDGLGITAAHQAGLKTAIITGRESRMVCRRAAELSISDIRQGVRDKVKVLGELAVTYGLAWEELCYTGDDLNDLAPMARVGLACAVANAVPEVKAAAHFVAAREGGGGAAREIIELVLKAQGKWGAIIDTYSRSGDINTKQ